MSVAGEALSEAERLSASAKVRKALIEAGIVESGLKNLKYGDRDSQGFLQQRPSQGWGTVRQVRNVRHATRKFVKAAQQIEGKYGRAGDLAQAVQRSAFPSRYQQASGQAQKIIRGSGTSGGGGGSRPVTVPGQDFSQQRKALVAQYLLGQTGRSDTQSLLDDSTNLLQTIATVRRLKDIPSKTVSDGGGGPGGAGRKGPGGLLELFWQGPGGINVKKGQREPQGFVSGHKDHVHIAASRGDIVKLGKLAQKMGLHVGENPHFGGVHPVHVKGSYHYSGRAADVSGDPRRERKFAHKVARLYGV